MKTGFYFGRKAPFISNTDTVTQDERMPVIKYSEIELSDIKIEGAKQARKANVVG